MTLQQSDLKSVQVYNSGLSFSIVRYGAPTDSLTPGGNVAVTPAGETSKAAPLARAQAGFFTPSLTAHRGTESQLSM